MSHRKTNSMRHDKNVAQKNEPNATKQTQNGTRMKKEGKKYI